MLASCSSTKPEPRPRWPARANVHRVASCCARRAAWPVVDHDLRRGPATFRDGCTVGARWADQPRCFPGLRRARARARTHALRHRRDEQLGSDEGTAARAVIEAASARLIFLQLYSPVFNPIEMALSKPKALLREGAVSTVEEFRAAIGRLFDSITPDGCANFSAGTVHQPDRPEIIYNISRIKRFLAGIQHVGLQVVDHDPTQN